MKRRAEFWLGLAFSILYLIVNFGVAIFYGLAEDDWRYRSAMGITLAEAQRVKFANLTGFFLAFGLLAGALKVDANPRRGGAIMLVSSLAGGLVGSEGVLVLGLIPGVLALVRKPKTAPAIAAPQPASQPVDYTVALKELNDLKNQGLITKQEFQAKKEELLRKI